MENFSVNSQVNTIYSVYGDDSYKI